MPPATAANTANANGSPSSKTDSASTPVEVERPYDATVEPVAAKPQEQASTEAQALSGTSAPPPPPAVTGACGLRMAQSEETHRVGPIEPCVEIPDCPEPDQAIQWRRDNFELYAV